jgi:hypothetical protein
MPALVCYAISKGAKTRDELQNSIETYGAVLKKANANFHPSLELEEGLSLTLKDLTERGVISNRTGTIPLRKPEVISYYANTIAHHFEST